MIKLYPKQQEVVDNLLKTYQNPQHIARGRLYISGEMGVGKTYMGSVILKKLQPKHALVLAPSTVLKKWQKVLASCNIDSIIINKKKAIADCSNLPQVVLASYNNYKYLLAPEDEVSNYCESLKKLQQKLTNSVKRNTPLMLKVVPGIYEDWRVKHDLISMELEHNLTNYSQNFDFVICDEVHLLKPSRREFSFAMSLLMKRQTKFLGLTGTLFSQNLSNLWQLLFLTNPELCNEFAINRLELPSLFSLSDTNDPDNLLNHISYFYNYIWRYIGGQISLSDLKQKSRADFDLKQAIMPLNGINMTREQELWQTIAQANLKILGISKQKADHIVNNYLDLPENSQPLINYSRKSLTNPDLDDFVKGDSTAKQTAYCGMYLKPIKLQETTKFKQCLSIVKQHPEKTLIFVQDPNLISKLAANLPHASYIPNNIDVVRRAKYLNDAFQRHQIMIATSKDLAVGIDLNNAQNIIWYQVPSDVTQILQAQRRVLRLSDYQKDSKVWFLYYKNTTQEKTILQVANSAVNNSATYNVRQDDNMARLSQVLFDGIGN